MDKARQQITKIRDLYTQRNDAVRAGKSAGRFDYALQAANADLELAISSLEKYKAIYDALALEGDEADQQLEVKLTEAQLTKRQQELIEIRDSAEPIIQMVSKGTGNIDETITGLRPKQVGTTKNEQPSYITD